MSQLQVAVYGYKSNAVRPLIEAFKIGLERHGAVISTHSFNPSKIPDADVHVFWSMRHPGVLQKCMETGQIPVCLERGYFSGNLNGPTDRHGPLNGRYHFTSVNLWDLNGKSQLVVPTDDSSRAIKHDWKMEEQSTTGEKIIIIGQIPGDMSLKGADIYHWANVKAREYEALGFGGNILFKPHPLAPRDGLNRVKIPLFEGSMDEALGTARLLVTNSSTSAVDAWMNGIPAIATSPVSMIWRDQAVDRTPVDTERWRNGISYRQFSADEFKSGFVWDLYGKQILGSRPPDSVERHDLSREGQARDKILLKLAS